MKENVQDWRYVVLFMKIANQKKKILLQSPSYHLFGGKGAEKSFILYMFEVLVKCESKQRCPLAIIYRGLE